MTGVAMLKKLGFLFVFLLALTCFGAFKVTKTIYRNDFTAGEIDPFMLSPVRIHQPKGGEKGDGALWMKNINYKTHSQYKVKLSPELFAEGGYYVIQGRYCGTDLKKGEQHWYGAGAVLCLREKSTKEKPRWEAAAPVYGTTAWSDFYQVFRVKPGDVTSAMFSIDLNRCHGDLFVDWVSISKAVEIPDFEVVAPENREAAKIRRGRDIKDPDSLKTWKGPVTQYRGTMVAPLHITEADIDELGRWGANLVRFAFTSPKRAKNGEEYIKFIGERMAHLDKLLPAFKRNGICIVVHPPMVPQGKSSIYASANLKDVDDFDCLITAWRMIAEHYRNEPNVIAYDLLNEPYGISKEKWHRLVGRMVKAIRSVDSQKRIYNPSAAAPTDPNMGYTPHYYSPHALTHQGVAPGSKIEWKYPGYINGVYWDKEQIRLALKPIIDYQEKYKVPIYIGEFSCIAWAQGRDEYIRDCIELFEEYGWDWTYHAFREWPPWSVEMERARAFKLKKAKEDTPAKKILLKYFRQNKK